TEGVLDGRSEDPQVQHVAAQMEDTAVKEHRRDDGQGRRWRVRGDPAQAREPARGDPELADEVRGRALPAWPRGHLQGELIAEDDDVQGDERQGDERQRPSANVVLEGDHGRGLTTTVVGCSRYRRATRVTSRPLTASSARR